MNGRAPLLEARDLDLGYGAVQVVWGLTLAVERGEVVSLIGSNGAGKTTTLKALAGLIPVRKGKISFDSKDLTNEPASGRVLSRLTLVPEGRQLWPRMTVEENLEMGAFSPGLRAGMRQDLERVYALFPLLKERRRQPAGTLSGGEQQMCALGRGLMSRPLLLLLDEPSLGLAPILVQQVFGFIRQIASEGVTILLAAQNARESLAISQRTYVLECGRLELEGESRELLRSDRIRRAYLGVSDG